MFSFYSPGHFLAVFVLLPKSDFKAYYYCQRTLITASVSMYESEIAAVRASASSISICGADVACCLYPAAAAVQPVSLNTLLRSWYLYNCTPCPFQHSSSQLIVDTCVSFCTAVSHSCSCSLCYFAALLLMLLELLERFATLQDVSEYLSLKWIYWFWYWTEKEMKMLIRYLLLNCRLKTICMSIL